ncbi:syntabulin-like isoform X1 [Acipenser ruthenus]|uniref:syntabulin-like isoform X1 n=1 Tax=Acipenser ruthenus TaxID=7906 RepID=UPI00145A4811|nr:syntabulin-like isoform X1 [Acipenser ruthenus]
MKEISTDITTDSRERSAVSSGMGPFQEYEEQKVQEKENARSRIPRLVLRPYRTKQKGSPVSESPFSEEESKDLSSGHSGRTISSNSFCSDDTGCPSSQSVSPSKTPSDTEISPIGFPSPGEEKENVKKTKSDAMAEWNAPPERYKREQRPCPLQRGSEADFSSSSSTGSISAREAMAASGGKKSSLTRSRGPHGKTNPSTHKSAVSPTTARDKELLSTFYRSQPHTASSHSSSSNSGSYKGSDTSPTISYRRTSTGRYASCGDHHGIKPPAPEQYLTPLQQKEVAIRHLKTKLKDSETRLHEKETEIEELKSQLGRMRDDWIEEECHRVEAQLALKEARKEIRQLRLVVETMKNSLVEKDKGIQKYFIDINIQNKKLESLLHSMELAQSGSLADEPTLDYICTSPDKSLAGSSASKMEDGMALEDQAAEEMADSGLLVNDEMANRTDFFVMSSTIEPIDNSQIKFSAVQSKIVKSTTSKKMLALPCGNVSMTEGKTVVTEKAIQTDVVPCTPDMQKLLLHLMKLQYIATFPSAAASSFPENPKAVLDLTPSDPNSAILVSPEKSEDSGICSESIENHIMKELDFDSLHEVSVGSNQQTIAVVERQYWSRSFLLDFLAVAVPVVPTVAWLFATQRGGTDPVYNIGALLRGCCVLGLHTLRRAPSTMYRPNIQTPNTH